MKILLTNDDGFQSPSLDVLCRTISEHHDVKVVAPAREQSAVSQAISLHRSLTYERMDKYPFEAFQVSGTPSDCVKLAVCHLFPDLRFDLVISGINPFENAGLSALYSGTVAGAREGATWGIPSVSLSVWNGEPVRSAFAADWMVKLLRKPELLKFEPGVFWSVNFPACDPGEINGIEVAAMSSAMFKDHYQEFVTPRNSSEYWLAGDKRRDQYRPGTDDAVLGENKISITPLQVDQTCEAEKKRLTALSEELIAL